MSTWAGSCGVSFGRPTTDVGQGIRPFVRSFASESICPPVGEAAGSLVRQVDRAVRQLPVRRCHSNPDAPPQCGELPRSPVGVPVLLIAPALAPIPGRGGARTVGRLPGQLAVGKTRWPGRTHSRVRPLVYAGGRTSYERRRWLDVVVTPLRQPLCREPKLRFDNGRSSRVCASGVSIL